MRYLLNLIRNRGTPPAAPLPGRPEPVADSAGGLVLTVDPWLRLQRFLVLGSEDGIYYVSEPQLTLDNTQGVEACLRENGARVVDLVVEIARSGRAPRHDPALFVLALASSSKFADNRTNSLALAALPLVVRTASQLATFVTFARELRGWGRALRGAVARWYVEKPAKDLAHQMIKYPSRSGWAQGDLIRLAHPKTTSAAHHALFRWALEGEIDLRTPLDLLHGDLRQLYGVEKVKDAQDEQTVAHLIDEHQLTHEMIPARWKNSAAVWEALVPGMPYAALVRNLGRLTAIGLLHSGYEAGALVVARLLDRGRIRRSRIHPMTLLGALLAYRSGQTVRGQLTWTPAPGVEHALETAFYAAFENVTPIGKRLYLALDASPTMQHAMVHGMPHVSGAMASAALALMLAKTEPLAHLAEFDQAIRPMRLTGRERLGYVVDSIARGCGDTDASLPMSDALARRLEIDAFVIVTGSQPRPGPRHAVEALLRYRREIGIPARLVVIEMAANRYTLAGPLDAGQMDIVGFDATVPALLADFLRG